MEEMEFETPELLKVLDEYAKRFEELVKAKMIARDSRGWNRVASGALLASIKATVKTGAGGVYSVELKHKDYMKYIENGTKPHFPPFKAILKWVREKPLPTRENSGNKGLPSEKSLAFLIQRKIGREGTEGKPIVARTQEELNAYFMPLFQKALVQDAETAIRKQMIHIQLHFQ